MFKQPNAYTYELEAQGDGGGSYANSPCVAVAEVSVQLREMGTCSRTCVGSTHGGGSGWLPLWAMNKHPKFNHFHPSHCHHPQMEEFILYRTYIYFSPQSSFPEGVNED